MRTDYREAQRRIEAQGAWGSPQARTERDAQASHFGDQAMRLEQIQDHLVFGRVDMTDASTHYIGRAGLPDSTGGRLLIDWRAPAARPFYQATAVTPAGVVRRRHIATSGSVVTGIEDDVLDVDAATDQGMTFQGEGALMSALASARGGHMSDIVATIQAEQDAIIRSDDQGIVVVQGGPGTGKTAVALHRAAYLLYTHRERLERSGVLIVGPSRIFLRYIEQVLPSLGENGVVSVPMGELVPGIHAVETDPAEVAFVKGKTAWIETAKAAVRDLQRLPAETKTFSIGGKTATLTPADVAAARSRARRSSKPHNVARTGFALDLIDVLVRQVAGADPDPEDLDWWRESVRSSRDVRREINLCWMPTRATDLLSRLYTKPDLLRRVARGLSAREQLLVSRPWDAPFTVADVPLLDELEELLGTSEELLNQKRRNRAALENEELERVRMAMEGQNLGGGIVSAEVLAERARGEREWTPLAERAVADRTWTYGHVVVDEAQDLSPMAWHALLRRCPARSFTVVGDLDQARGHQRPANWEKALGPAKRGLSSEFILTVSYRTPATVTTLAQQVLSDLGQPPLYPLTSAREVEDALADTVVQGGDTNGDREEDPLWKAVQDVVAQEESLLDATTGHGMGRIGVLVADERAHRWRGDIFGSTALDHRVSVLSVAGAKGLEFDTTIVVEPTEILSDGPGDLFVAMTRCTKRLHSVRSTELPRAWAKAVTSVSDEWHPEAGH
ncbi:AAA family ATPase [Schaalia sp. JY-X169]|uniref:HelD family protein n=1 Tax=Schaalia sp. JY-X169 TaxID=2758572 RepID=UPI0015F51875